MSDTTKLITLDNLKSFATQVDATFMRKGDMNGYVTDDELNQSLTGKVDTDLFETLSGTVQSKADASDLETVATDLETVSGAVGDIESELSGKASTTDLELVSGAVETIENELSGKASTTDLESVSGAVEDIEGELETVTTDLKTVSGTVETKIDATKANELIEEKLKGFSTTDELVKQVDAVEGTYSLLLTGADLPDSGVGNVQKDEGLTFNVGDNTLSTTNVKASNLLSGDTNVIEIIESTTEFIPDEGVSTVEKLGGIAANTSSDELSGKTINELLNLMLFPEVNGKATKPNVTIGKTTNFSGVLEKGIAGPTLSDFTTTFDDGNLSYAVGDDGVVVKNAANTSGVISSGITCGSEEVTDAATPSTLTADSYTYKLTVNAGSAELSLATNKGKAISGAYAGGNLTASTTISLAYPIYYGLVTASPETITSGDITSLTSEVTNSYDAKTLKGNGTTCRFCFAVDKNRTYKKFVDSNTFDVTLSYEQVTVKVKTQYGLEVDYNVYISNEQSTDDAYSVTAYK